MCSPAPGCCLRKRSKVAQGDLDRARRSIREHVGGAVWLQQRHLAEGHAGGKRRQTHTVRQGDMHRAAAQKEEGDGGLAGGNDLLAGLVFPDLSDRGQISQFLGRQASEQGLFGQFGRLVEVDGAAITINDLVFRPLDCGIEQIEVADVCQAAGPFPR